MSRANLEEIPNDIHHLIVSDLTKSNPSSVLALGQSSKALREAVLPFVYHDVVLRQGVAGSKARQAYQALVKKFREDRDREVARHVRSITVKDEIPTEDLATILEEIAEYGMLRKLSWGTAAHIPSPILDKLHATWPDLELSVCVLDRKEVPNHAHRQMDYRLLSSTLLRELTYTIYNEGYPSEEPGRSEWPKLTRALEEGGHVRVLRIQNAQDGTSYYGSKMLRNENPEKMKRLDITPDARLPQLEEFTIREDHYFGTRNYLFDDEHCSMLRDAMDWSRLRKLDFGSNRPDGFFSAFTGLVPQLKSLRFGVRDGVIQHAKAFLESIEALESLDIDRAAFSWDELYPAIWKHKETLRELILRPSTVGYCQPQYIPLSWARSIADHFLGLERFGWDAPCKSNVDSQYLEAISPMNLKHLDLFLHVPFESSDFADELRQNAMGSIAPPRFTKEAAQTAAIQLMERLNHGENGHLERLTLHFTRTGLQDRAQPYLMYAQLQLRRRIKERGSDIESSSEEYEVRGRQEWEGGVTTLMDELEMEE